MAKNNFNPSKLPKAREDVVDRQLTSWEKRSLRWKGVVGKPIKDGGIRTGVPYQRIKDDDSMKAKGEQEMKPSKGKSSATIF